MLFLVRHSTFRFFLCVRFRFSLWLVDFFNIFFLCSVCFHDRHRCVGNGLAAIGGYRNNFRMAKSQHHSILYLWLTLWVLNFHFIWALFERIWSFLFSRTSHIECGCTLCVLCRCRCICRMRWRSYWMDAFNQHAYPFATGTFMRPLNLQNI